MVGRLFVRNQGLDGGAEYLTDAVLYYLMYSLSKIVDVCRCLSKDFELSEC